MKSFAILTSLLVTTFSWGQVKKSGRLLSFGIDYRMYPIDIEDVPRGPLPPDNGLPSDDSKFWQPLSIHGRYGLMFEKNLVVAASFYGRYNLLHRVEARNNFFSPFSTVINRPPEKVKEKKNLKFDFFIVRKENKNKKSQGKIFIRCGGSWFYQHQFAV